MAKRIRTPGEFCWINMLTPEPAQAREFFGALFGWTYTDIGFGHIIKVGDSDIGGLWDANGPNMPKGFPPSIGVMVKVDSADAMSAKANSLGGRTKEVMDVMENGRMAVLFDPAGANIDVWQPLKQPGTDVDNATHGAPSWFELATNDTKGSAAFYTKLFGWTAEEMQMPGMVYTVFKLGTEQAGGMLQLAPEMGPMPPHWATYITATDVDATAREAEKLGASFFVPTMDIPGIGRFCGIMSPQGVPFYAITYAPRVV